MISLVEAGERLDGPVGAPAFRLSRRERAVVAGAALLAVILVIAAVAASRSYGPIEAGGVFISPRPVGGVDYRSVNPIAGGKQAFAVDARKPGAFGLVFEIENRGRLPLTFEDSRRDPAFVVQQDVRISSAPVNRDPRAGRDIPLAGVTLAPGERRRLHVTFSWKEMCAEDEEDDGYGFSAPTGVELRYSGLSVFRRTQSVEMPYDVVLVCGMDLSRLGDYLVEPPYR